MEQPRRNYSRAWEDQHWDWELVLQELGNYAAKRRIDGSGKIGVYGRKLYVGVAIAKALKEEKKEPLVYLQFDPERTEWIVSAEDGRQLHRTPAEWVTPSNVRHLQLSQPAAGGKRK